MVPGIARPKALSGPDQPAETASMVRAGFPAASHRGPVGIGWTRLRRAGMVAIAVLGLVSAAFIGGAWYFSDRLYDAALSAAAKRAEATAASYPVRVLSVSEAGLGGGEITLQPLSNADAVLAPGTWGIESSGGAFGQVSEIVGTAGGSVTRRYARIDGPDLRSGDLVRVTSEAFPEDPARALGLAYEDAAYRGPLGLYPAWYVPGSPDDWAILVHGNSLRRADMVRLMAPIHDAGLSELVISYRNDAGAPPDPTGRLAYGATEWRDLEAAVAYAVSAGARRVVLAGVSMGGGVVMSFLYRSSLAAVVSLVILDSPMLDFSSTVRYGGAQSTLPLVNLAVPGPMVGLSMQLAGARFGIDWADLDYLAQDSRLRWPILLFQGTADGTVPPATSARLAADRSDLVTYVATPGAAHVESWNANPSRYDAEVRAFLAKPLPSSPG